MSLVITAWNPSVGIAVCDGRALGYQDGERVIASEDYYKLARLPNGGILGFAGRLREGYPIVNSLMDVIENHLLPDVSLAAREMEFSRLCRFIPERLKAYAARWPELLLFVSLLGSDGDNGIRGGAWDSNGGAQVLTEPGTHWLILGPETLAEYAHIAVPSALRVIGGLRNPSRAGDVLQGIIRRLAASNDDINDHTRAEYLFSQSGVDARSSAAHVPAFAELTADLITSGTLDASLVDVVNINASNIDTGTLSADKVLFPDGSDMTTAARVQTSNAKLTTASSLPSSQWIPVNGLAWNVQAESASDVYNVQGVGSISIGGTAGTGMVRFGVFVDGNTGTNYGSGFIYASMPTSAQVSASGAYFGSITGLTAGTHTIQVYAWNNTTQSATINDGYAICQRIF